MPRYMLIVKDDKGMLSTHFFDDYHKAEDNRSIAEVSLGYYTELYERTTDEDGLRSYVLMY